MKIPTTTVPDHVVRAAIRRTRIVLSDTYIKVDARFVRWSRASVGQLTCIVVNPISHRRFVVGVCNTTHRVRVLGPAA